MGQTVALSIYRGVMAGHAGCNEAKYAQRNPRQQDWASPIFIGEPSAEKEQPLL